MAAAGGGRRGLAARLLPLLVQWCPAVASDPGDAPQPSEGVDEATNLPHNRLRVLPAPTPLAAALLVGLAVAPTLLRAVLRGRGGGVARGRPDTADTAPSSRAGSAVRRTGSPPPSSSAPFLCDAAACLLAAFVFGWHVHEKAGLYATVPLLLAGLASPAAARAAWLLSVPAHYALVPLVFTARYVTVCRSCSRPGTSRCGRPSVLRLLRQCSCRRYLLIA